MPRVRSTSDSGSTARSSCDPLPCSARGSVRAPATTTILARTATGRVRRSARRSSGRESGTGSGRRVAHSAQRDRPSLSLRSLQSIGLLNRYAQIAAPDLRKGVENASIPCAVWRPHTLHHRETEVGRVTYRPAKKFTATIAGVSALALVLTACGSSSTSSSTLSAGSQRRSQQRSIGAPRQRRSGQCRTGERRQRLVRRRQGEFGDLTGTTVSVYTVIVAPEDKPYVETVQAVHRVHRRSGELRRHQGVRGPDRRPRAER